MTTPAGGRLVGSFHLTGCLEDVHHLLQPQAHAPGPLSRAAACHLRPASPGGRPGTKSSTNPGATPSTAPPTRCPASARNARARWSHAAAPSLDGTYAACGTSTAPAHGCTARASTPHRSPAPHPHRSPRNRRSRTHHRRAHAGGHRPQQRWRHRTVAAAAARACLSPSRPAPRGGRRADAAGDDDSRLPRNGERV